MVQHELTRGTEVEAPRKLPRPRTTAPHPKYHPHLRLSTSLITSDILTYHKPMSSAPNTTSTPFNFGTLFDDALTKYTKLTGKDLHSHPLASIIDRCDSPDSILAIFKEQSRAFDEFRNGDPKLIKSLGSLVNLLHAISTSAVTSAGASLVGPSPFHILLPT